jgi:type II secretory ATPase GspE/PulE/Tfp pilus assembly ATPase PilB-like protein
VNDGTLQVASAIRSTRHAERGAVRRADAGAVRAGHQGGNREGAEEILRRRRRNAGRNGPRATNRWNCWWRQGNHRGDQEASVIKFVNQIIWEAFKDRATDIHFEPAEDELRIRYRIDGILHQTPMPPQLKRYQAALISRIKVMSGMNIAEKRLPQDGRINVRIKGEEIDIRVSTVPTVYGESVSLRLLTRGKIFLSLDKLGFAPRKRRASAKSSSSRTAFFWSPGRPVRANPRRSTPF